MKKTCSALVVAAALAFAPSAHAQFALDLKVAYAIPMGDAFISEGVNQALSDNLSGAMPLGIDARYRFTPNLSAGVYFQYSPAFVKSSACDPGASCSASNVRLGIEAVYGFMPEAGFNPWVSLGTGWEWATFKQSAGGVDVSATLDGWGVLQRPGRRGLRPLQDVLPGTVRRLLRRLVQHLECLRLGHFCLREHPFGRSHLPQLVPVRREGQPQPLVARPRILLRVDGPPPRAAGGADVTRPRSLSQPGPRNRPDVAAGTTPAARAACRAPPPGPSRPSPTCPSWPAPRR